MDMSMLTFPKRSREDGKREREQKKTEIRTFEQEQKKLVRQRDGAAYCRLVPACSETRGPFETAHLDDKGMGGDHGHRSTADLMVRACWFHHQGNWSLHSHDLRVEFLTPDKANGPIAVWGRISSGEFVMLGREKSVGQWERD